MQAGSLLPGLTVEENIELGAYLEPDKKLVRTRLAAVLEQFPLIRGRLQDRAGSLSGGQQRTVEFARALMLDPALVVLDEPSMGPAPKTAGALSGTIRRMQREGTPKIERCAMLQAA